MYHSRKASLIIVPAVLLSLLLAAVYAQHKGLQSQPGLGIEIAMSKGPFYLPAPAADKTISAVIRVTSAESPKDSPEPISAVKIVPQMAANKVKITVYALYGDSSGFTSCKDWNTLRSTPVASYVAGLGEEIRVSKLLDLGARFGRDPLTIQIVPKKELPLPAPPDRPGGGRCECGTCNSLTCCPNPGYCIGCGSCGTVCCGSSDLP